MRAMHRGTPERRPRNEPPEAGDAQRANGPVANRDSLCRGFQVPGCRACPCARSKQGSNQAWGSKRLVLDSRSRAHGHGAVGKALGICSYVLYVLPYFLGCACKDTKSQHAPRWILPARPSRPVSSRLPFVWSCVPWPKRAAHWMDGSTSPAGSDRRPGWMEWIDPHLQLSSRSVGSVPGLRQMELGRLSAALGPLDALSVGGPWPARNRPRRSTQWASPHRRDGPGATRNSTASSCAALFESPPTIPSQPGLAVEPSIILSTAPSHRRPGHRRRRRHRRRHAGMPAILGSLSTGGRAADMLASRPRATQHAATSQRQLPINTTTTTTKASPPRRGQQLRHAANASRPLCKRRPPRRFSGSRSQGRPGQAQREMDELALHGRCIARQRPKPRQSTPSTRRLPALAPISIVHAICMHARGVVCQLTPGSNHTSLPCPPEPSGSRRSHSRASAASGASRCHHRHSTLRSPSKPSKAQQSPASSPGSSADRPLGFFSPTSRLARPPASQSRSPMSPPR